MSPPAEVTSLYYRLGAVCKSGFFIFLSSAGTIVSTSQVNTEFKKALEKYDILDNTLDGDVTCHSCRHTYATRFLESGSGVKVLQSLLGHSEIKITLGVYCDVQDSFKQAQLDTSNKYLENNNLSIIWVYTAPKIALNSSKSHCLSEKVGHPDQIEQFSDCSFSFAIFTQNT